MSVVLVVLLFERYYSLIITVENFGFAPRIHARIQVHNSYFVD
jgi:hypothetical protein